MPAWRRRVARRDRRSDESIAEAKRAEILDPMSGIVVAGVSWMYHLSRLFEEERLHAQRALVLNPRLAIGHQRLGSALSALGRHQEAIDSLQSAVKHSAESADMLGALGYALARAGRHGEAREMLDRMRTISARHYVSAFSIALVHIALGDRRQALDALETAYEERSWGLAFIGVEPALDPLRGEPRFDELVRRMRLPARAR